MLRDLSNWLRTRSHNRRRSVRAKDPVSGIERLEDRVVLDVTLASISGMSFAGGKDLFVPLTPADGTDPVNYSVQTSDANVTAEVLAGGQSLRMTVNVPDGSGGFTQEILTYRLFESIAPDTTARIKELVNQNAYDDNPSTAVADHVFHRVIDDFVAQAGDFQNRDGTGGSGEQFDDEFDPRVTFTSRGLLAMANSGDDTNDSQFFTVDTDLDVSEMPQHLNFNHTIFGILTSGFDAFDRIMTTSTDSNDRPETEIEIESVEVIDDVRNGVLRISAPEGFTGSVQISATATNANDGNDTDTETFDVNVLNDTVNDRAFLGDVTDQTTVEDTPVTFQVEGFDLENDDLQFVVRRASDFSAAPQNVTAEVSVTPASGSTPAFATVTLTPADDFAGTIDLVIGVRDGTNRAFGGSLNSEANFDTQEFRLTVTAVEDDPVANSTTTSITEGEPHTANLPGNDGDPEVTQAVTFAITRQPDHGTISNFNASTGAYTYTPDAGFTGTDSFNFTVTQDDTQVTSNTGTVTLVVEADAPDAPTGLDLLAGSDDGFYSDDNFTSVANPMFTVNAEPGSTVTLTVNGATNATATEISSGVFQATLSRAHLRVGGNTVTATASRDGNSSPASASLAFTYAPNYENVYTVPGAPGQSQTILFQWTSRQAAYDNEMGLYPVDDHNGTVNGVAPGSPGYAAVALSNATVLFGSGQGAGASSAITLPGGTIVGFYLVADDSTGAFLAENPSNRGSGPKAYFSVPAANPDGVDHARSVGDGASGAVLYHWEDKFGGGDRDYNDVVFTARPAGSGASDVAAALRVPAGPSHMLTTSFRLRRFPGIEGEFGLFVTEDEAGRINGLSPSDSGFAAAALGSASRQAIFQTGDAAGTLRQLSLQGSSLLGFYFVSGGTADDLLNANPDNVVGGGPIAFFSFDAGNPDGVEHFRWFNREFDDSEAGGLLLHGMTDLGGGESDFDDLLVEIDFGV